MTSLFTQVWLWSLAAFLLGAVATWLLMVLPMRRRLRLLRAELANADGAVVTPTEWVAQDAWSGGGASPTHAEHASTVRDVPPIGSPEEPDQESSSEPEPSPDRPFRSEDLSGYWSLRRGAPATPEPAGTGSRGDEDGAGGDGAATEITAQLPAWAEEAGSVRADPSGTGSRRDVPAAAGEAAQRREDRRRTPRTSSAALPEEEPLPEEQGGNTWFREGRWTDPGQVPPEGGDDGESQSLSGQLRSLFEPLGSTDRSPERADAVHTSPARGAQNDSVEATGPSEQADESSDDQVHNPLPRRVPGATSRPGTPPANRPAGEEPSFRERAEPTTRWPSAEDAAVSITGPASGPEEWYPDELRPPQAPPDEGHTVKGHFASRQYHTTESPHFERVAAEVWFRTPADAEQAGFEPWDGHRRS